MDAKTGAWLDQQDALVTENVRIFGLHIEYVFGGTHCGHPECDDCGFGRDDDDDETSFAYTVGLFGIGHPELLVHGVSPHTAMSVLNELADRVQRGSVIVPRTVINLLYGGRRVVAEVVPNPGQIVFTANRHYGLPDSASVPVLQLTWDDQFGRFPWDDGYTLPGWVQPRPGEFTA